MVQDKPVAGVGAGNFPVSSIHYLLRPGKTQRDEIIVDKQKVAHNIYLTVLSEPRNHRLRPVCGDSRYVPHQGWASSTPVP